MEAKELVERLKKEWVHSYYEPPLRLPASPCTSLHLPASPEFEPTLTLTLSLTLMDSGGDGVRAQEVARGTSKGSQPIQ